MPAYTFPATANVVALAGAQPVLVDVDPETMNLRPAVADAVTERTRAVLVVHLFGRPARWEEITAAVPDGVVLRGRRRRRARRPAGGPCLRRPRAARLPLVPPTQDRHHRRGRCDHDERR